VFDVEEFEKLLDNLPYPTYVIDGEGRIKLWNRICEEISGIFRGEVLNTSYCWKLYSDREFKTPALKLLKSCKDRIEEVIQSERGIYKVLAFRFKDFIVEVVKNVEKNIENKTFEKFINYIVDFYNPSKFKIAIKSFTEDLININYFEVYIKIKENYKLIFRNPTISGDEVLSSQHPLAKLIVKQIRCSDYPLIIEGDVFTSNFKNCYLVPILFENEIVGFVQLYSENLNKLERKYFEIWKNILSIILKKLKVEYELKEKTHWLECIVRNCKEGILIIDKNLKIIYFNNSFRNLTGYDNIIGYNIGDIVSDVKQIDYAIKQALTNDCGFCRVKLIKKDGSCISCNLYIKPVIVDNFPVSFCCSISVELNDILELYKQVYNLIIKEKSYTSIFSKFCKIVERVFQDIAFTWCCVTLENPKIYSPKRGIERNLKNNKSLIRCLYRNCYERDVIFKDCSDCYLTKLYRDGYYYCFPVTYERKFYGMFGAIFKVKPDKTKLEALGNAVDAVGFAARCIELGRKVDYLISGIQKEVTKVRIICDRLINPVSGTSLLFECLLNEVDSMDKKEIKEKIEVCYTQLKKLSESTKIIKEIEEELLKRTGNL